MIPGNTGLPSSVPKSSLVMVEKKGSKHKNGVDDGNGVGDTVGDVGNNVGTTVGVGDGARVGLT